MTTSTQAPSAVPSATVPAQSTRTQTLAPIQTRSERLRSFESSDFAALTGREVNWKHTPIDRLAALFDDEAGSDQTLTVTVTAPDDVIQAPKAAGQAPRGEVYTPDDLIGALAWKHAAEAMHISIPAARELDEPIIVDVHGNGGRAHVHVVIEAQANSRAVVVLRHGGTADTAAGVEMIVRDGAHLTVVTVQQWADDATHAASHQARVDKDATLRHIVVSFGGGVVRINPSVELAGTGSQGELFGLTYADAGQHLESQVFLFHKGADTRGDVLYKGALQGVGAHSVWIGDVLIGPDGTGTDSYEANRNLVLTDGARADSIPNLEIETGDIRGAGHASATGRFDDEQLFYLQARGISEDEARRLVVQGFLSDIVQRIGIADLERELTVAIEAELVEGALA